MLQFLIADDHITMRQAIVQLIRDEWPEAFCLEVGDGEQLVADAGKGRWDMVVSDIAMPRISGMKALEMLQNNFPNLPVLIVSIHREAMYGLSALRAGARGYLTKSDLQQELICAIRTILAGCLYVSKDMAVKLGDPS